MTLEEKLTAYLIMLGLTFILGGVVGSTCTYDLLAHDLNHGEPIIREITTYCFYNNDAAHTWACN